MFTTASHSIEGHVSRGFGAVREAFAGNFAHRRELGGACCAYRGGEKVVDLWGGIRNKQTGEPWEQNTMVIVHSATKGLAAMTLAIAHSRGRIDYEERVCTLLAGVRTAGQRANHRPPASGTPGRAICDRRTSRSRRRRGRGSPCKCIGAAEARVEPGTRQAYTPSASGSTRASCCGAWIHDIAVSDSSFRTRSPLHSVRRFTSGCRRRSRTRAWPHFRRRARSVC